MDPQRAVESLGGAARKWQLLAMGCTSASIRKAAHRGTVRRVARGVYAVPTAPTDAVLAATLGAGLTCVSALERLGLPLWRLPRAPHLAVAHNFAAKSRVPRDARIHYQGPHPIPGATANVADALDVAGSCVDEVWHLVAVDAALNRGLITLGDVMDFRRSSKERREFLLRNADPRAEAPGETIARLQLVRAGFSVRPQAHVDGAGHVDIEVNGILIVQVDGYGPHSGRPAFMRDREKSRAVIKAGRPQLSYAASELLSAAPVNVAHDVRVALDEWREKDARGRVPS